MKAGQTYLLGTGKPYPGTWNRAYVTFTPASSGRPPVFGFADGFFPHDCAGWCEAVELLNKPAYVRMLSEFDLGWLIPYVERMAAGESFTVDALQRIYYQHTGRQMEVSSKLGHFGFMEHGNENEVT